MNGVSLEGRMSTATFMSGKFSTAKNNVPNVRFHGENGSDERVSDFIARTYGFDRADAHKLLGLYGRSKEMYKVVTASCNLSASQKKRFVSSLSRDNYVAAYLDIVANPESIFKYVLTGSNVKRKETVIYRERAYGEETQVPAKVNPACPKKTTNYSLHPQVVRLFRK